MAYLPQSTRTAARRAGSGGRTRPRDAGRDHGLRVSASTVTGHGVAQWTPDELPADLLRRADEALYAAKRGGGDAASGGA